MNLKIEHQPFKMAPAEQLQHNNHPLAASNPHAARYAPPPPVGTKFAAGTPRVRVKPDQIVFYFQNTGGKMRKQNWYWGKPKCQLAMTDQFHADSGDDELANAHRQNRPQARVCIPKVARWSPEDHLVVWEYKPNAFNFKLGDTIGIQDTRYVVPLKYILAIEQERSGNVARHLLAPQLPSDLHFNFTDLLYGCRRHFRFRANFVYIIAVMRLQHNFSNRESHVEQLVASNSRHFTILAEPKLARGQTHKEDQRKRNQRLLVKLSSIPTPRVVVQQGDRLPDKVRDSMYQLMEVTQKETRGKEPLAPDGTLPLPTLHHPHAFSGLRDYGGSVRYGNGHGPNAMLGALPPIKREQMKLFNEHALMNGMPNVMGFPAAPSWNGMPASPSPLALPPDIAMAQAPVPTGDMMPSLVTTAHTSTASSPNLADQPANGMSVSPATLPPPGYTTIPPLLPPHKRSPEREQPGAARSSPGGDEPAAKRARISPPVAQLDHQRQFNQFAQYRCPVTYEDQMNLNGDMELRDSEHIHVNGEIGSWRVRGADEEGPSRVGSAAGQQHIAIQKGKQLDAMYNLHQLKMSQQPGRVGAGGQFVGKHIGLHPDKWTKIPIDVQQQLFVKRNGELFINMEQMRSCQLLGVQQLDQAMQSYSHEDRHLDHKLKQIERKAVSMEQNLPQNSRSKNQGTDSTDVQTTETEFENLTEVVAGLSNISLTVESNQKSLELQSERAKFAKWYGPLQDAMASELDEYMGKCDRREFLVKCQEFFNNAITLFGIQSSTENSIMPLKKGREIFPRECQKNFLKKQKIYKDPIDREGVEKLKTYTYGLIALAVHMGISFFNKQFLLGLPTMKASSSEIRRHMKGDNTTLLRISSSQPHTIILCRKRSNGKISQTKIEGVIGDWGGMIGWNLLFGKTSEVSKPTFYRSLVAILKAVKFDNAKKFEFDPLVFNVSRAPDVHKVHAVLQGVL